MNITNKKITIENAQFVGVGVGPGDPELITVKAYRIIQDADVVVYLANSQGLSQAKKIAELALSAVTKQQENIPICMPMNEDRRIANQIYDAACLNIQARIDDEKKVVFLCEGDPLFFGSFAYLLERLQKNNSCMVVPGISSVHAASAALQVPLTRLKQSFAVVSGRHSEKALLDALNNYDSVVIMKAGQSRSRILEALEKSGRSGDAHYLEYIGRDNEYILKSVSELNQEAGPYFSLFVVIRRDPNEV